MTLSLFDYEFQTQISLFVLYNKINIRTDVILFLAGGRGGKEVKKNINAAENLGIPEFICVLDRSLSMYGREKIIIQSFNRWLEKQQENSGEALVTVALCNEKCELLYSRMPMQYVRKMDSFSFPVRKRNFPQSRLFPYVWISENKSCSRICQTCRDDEVWKHLQQCKHFCSF